MFPDVRGAQVRISQQGRLRHRQGRAGQRSVGLRDGRRPRREGEEIWLRAFADELRDDYEKIAVSQGLGQELEVARHFRAVAL